MSARNLEAARQRLASAEQHLREVSERVRTEERKADTRQKIILGGALLALKREDPEAFEAVKSSLGKFVGNRDRKWLSDVGLGLD